MANEGQAPKTQWLNGIAPAVATGADGTVALFRAPFAAIVSAVNFIANALLTGANTNTRSLAIVNKGQNGAGAVTVATLQFNNGINAPAFDETAITLSATAADLVVAEGDILALVSTHIGTGIADPGGLFSVKFARTPTAS